MSNLVFASITNIFSTARDNGSYFTQLTLSGGVKVNCNNCKEVDFPANGLLVAFELTPTGKSPNLVRWGIPRLANGTKPGEAIYSDTVSVEWRFTAPVSSNASAPTW